MRNDYIELNYGKALYKQRIIPDYLTLLNKIDTEPLLHLKGNNYVVCQFEKIKKIRI